MLSLNLKYGDLSVDDIKREDLPNVLRWYNMTHMYKYATGIDRAISLSQLVEKYLKIIKCEREFFTGIRIKGALIGILKGRVNKESPNTLWISLLLIDSHYQRRGYGKTVINMISDYFRYRYHVKRIFVTVIQDNIQGINFWRKNGFEIIRNIYYSIPFDGEKKIVLLMKKDI
ncbi:MAG: GNAT family N-acetyltransferase [Clostridiaceae bacterium]|nr:GNAT family N-acetyltransferase [Clostridiaceae bacterium]